MRLRGRLLEAWDVAAASNPKLPQKAQVGGASGTCPRRPLTVGFSGKSHAGGRGAQPCLGPLVIVGERKENLLVVHIFPFPVNLLKCFYFPGNRGKSPHNFVSFTLCDLQTCCINRFNLRPFWKLATLALGDS